jgi:hypothetical protein
LDTLHYPSDTPWAHVASRDLSLQMGAHPDDLRSMRVGQSMDLDIYAVPRDTTATSAWWDELWAAVEKDRTYSATRTSVVCACLYPYDDLVPRDRRDPEELRLSAGGMLWKFRFLGDGSSPAKSWQKEAMADSKAHWALVMRFRD